MVVDFDDFGANHVISPQCQSHDCRDKLDGLHFANPNFKVTLFAIPSEMTIELAGWCMANRSWVELAVHGYYHSNNYECEKMTYEEFDQRMRTVAITWPDVFSNGFKAPGWQISDDIYRWLKDNGWWMSDQAYNNKRRPAEIPTYINNNDNGFLAWKGSAKTSEMQEVQGIHGHTWDCCGNGIYETFDFLKETIKDVPEFKFVREVLDA